MQESRSDPQAAHKPRAALMAREISLCKDCGGSGPVPPVATAGPANAYGVYDIIRGVHEWAEDCYVRTYADKPVDGSPARRGDCSQAISRGYTWRDAIEEMRAGDGVPRTERDSKTGFRVARTLP